MSSEATNEGYGQTSVEKSQGWERMPLAHPVEPALPDEPLEAPDPYAPLSPRDAAQMLNDPRNRPVMPREPEENEKPPIPVAYHQAGGERDGEGMDPRLTVSAEQAAADLTRFRETIGENIEAAEQQQIRDAVEQLRGEQTRQAPEPEATAAEQKTEEQPQAPEQASATAEDGEITKLLQSNPELLSMLEQTVASFQQEAARAQQQYQQAAQQNAQLTIAAISQQIPELRGVDFNSWGAVLQSLASSNPARHSQITQMLQGTREVFAQAYQATAQEQQRNQQQTQQQAEQVKQRFQADANFADSQLDQYRQQQGVSEEHFKELRNEALNILRESGMSDQDISAQYTSNPLFRSFAAQKMMFDAARWRMSQRSLATKVAPKPVPPMQRPGDPSALASDRDISNRKLENRLNYTGHWKDAAALLNARRSGRR